MGTTRNRAQVYEVEETKIGGACDYLSVMTNVHG
ncbi:hypothetical protein T4B_6274 [Trichinella pseudospiralis]|uniref:Uncharacterized protein n=1 Tax=Trichinella pseudospiralis TaxID=6337 RepID=A0A0V1GJN4_TRIPS|nr:hypothetical protein T4B_6274 [Trichinella pseudospiralis]